MSTRQLTAILAAAGLALALLVLYVRSAAPDVLSGDSAEFQLVAAILGVAHPGTYPLYTLLGHLSVLTLPLGPPAWRVTLVSAVCAALAAGLFVLLARRSGLALPAALTGGLALGLAPGFWNAATMAEVYALLMLLLVLLALLLAGGAATRQRWPIAAAAFVGGLGFTHHGLFVLSGLPLLAGYLAWQWRKRDLTLRDSVLYGACFAAGLTPWLYPLVQFARFGPFNGKDFGLPRLFFWGAPESWGEVFALLSGGPIRAGIFRLPTLDAAGTTLAMVGQRLWFEFGPLGLLLGIAGLVALWQRNRALMLGALWMAAATLGYLLLLGPAVQDAPVFTIVLLLPCALGIATGADRLLGAIRRATPARLPATHITALLLLLATLTWGATRLPYADKRHLTLFRSFGSATLAQLPPDAVVITHWEQGTTLQYLRLVEGLRRDIWVDIVEPGDEAWGVRAARRYTGRPVYFVGAETSVAGLPVELVFDPGYARVYRLRSAP